MQTSSTHVGKFSKPMARLKLYHGAPLNHETTTITLHDLTD
ncbi:unnamed protein product [Rhodiola kirilowii]